MFLSPDMKDLIQVKKYSERLKDKADAEELEKSIKEVEQ